jgi:hypothetical protein
MLARLQGSPEIPHMRIVGDTRGSGESGTAHKRQAGMLTGMLASVLGTKLPRIWSNQRYACTPRDPDPRCTAYFKCQPHFRCHDLRSARKTISRGYWARISGILVKSRAGMFL